ncbi:MAG: FCD domain-containing protein, partial [Armatimonadetes bacterium]|nr:FCD domain-containing protein [Armatimonadota bacterium]
RRGDSGSEIGMELHMEFHLDLARLTGFELLWEQLEAVWLRHLMQINWLNAALQPVPSDWHQSLLAALGSGDPDAAERAMREHVRYGADHLARAVQELGGADAGP